MAPGIHPKQVNSVTIRMEPHPLSVTAKGGNRQQSKNLVKDIDLRFYLGIFRLATAKFMNKIVGFLNANLVQYLVFVGCYGKAKSRVFMVARELNDRLWFCTNIVWRAGKLRG